MNIQGLAAGTYSTAMTVAASGTTHSPQQIPVSLTLSKPAPAKHVPPVSAGCPTENQISPPITVGTVATYTATNLTSGRTYYFCISPFDSAGNESPCSAEVAKPIL